MACDASSSPARVVVRLKPGRDAPVRRGHPWIFSGAVDHVEGDAVAGAVADVLAADGAWLARGLFNPAADLRVRVYSRQPDEPLTAEFFCRRLDEALRLRELLFASMQSETDAWRLVFSESDGLSGLIVDRYADVLCVQVGAAALLPFLEPILNHLKNKTNCSVYVRPDEEAAPREGLDPSAFASTPPPGPVPIREHGKRFLVDVVGGQKTGFFLDQRDNRALVAAYARGRRVLSAYCYTGAFEVHAAAAGAASIVGVDRSQPALDAAAEHHRMNSTQVPVEYIRGNVPDVLRQFRDANRVFDLIILDPPRFVLNRAQLEKGLRAYKDINLLALKLLSPGGLLATFSCSGLVGAEDFRRVLTWAATDAQRRVKVLAQFRQPPDHPVLLEFPESQYLKGFLVYAE